MCTDSIGPQGENSRSGSTKGRPIEHWSSVLHRRWDLILIVGLLALCWPLFLERGAIVQTDYPCWASIVNMFDTEVFPACRWFWGVPVLRENAGEILGQPYSLAIILPWLLAKLMPVQVALKLVIVITYFTLAFGLYYFVRPRCCRLLAALVAYLCVLENLRIINYGMWYNCLSIGLAFWFWAVLYRYANTGKSQYWVSALLLLTLIVFAHPLGVMMALPGWIGYVLYLLAQRAQYGWRTILLATCIPLLAFALTFPQTNASLSGNVVPFDADRVAVGYHLFNPLGPYLGWLVLLSAVAGCGLLLTKQRDFACIVVLALLAGHIGYLQAPSHVPFDFPLKGGLMAFASRFELVISSVLLIPYALGLSWALTACRSSAGAHRLILRNAAETILMLSLLGTFVYGATHTLTTQARFLVGEQGLADHRDFRDLCNWIRREIDHRNERVYVEDSMGSPDLRIHPSSRLGRVLAGRLPSLVPEPIPADITNHYLALISLLTPTQQVNGFPVYRNAFGRQYCEHNGRLFGMKPEALSEEHVRDQMWVLNCRHVVAHSPAVCGFLESLDFLKQKAKFGKFQVFTWEQMLPHDAWLDGPGRVLVPSERPDYLAYRLDLRDLEGEAVCVSAQYHPNWKAQLEGQDLVVRPWNSLMRIAVPPGQKGILVLRYEIDRALCLAIVCLGLGASTLCFALARKRSGTPDHPGRT